MIILVLLVHAAFSMIFPIGRAVAPIASPIFFTAVRMLFAGAALLAYHYLRYRSFSKELSKAVWPILGFSITGIFLTNVPEFWALQYLPAAKAAFMYSLSPFAAAVFSYFLFNEVMTYSKLLGMAIGLIGFGVMIAVHSPGEVAFNAVGYFSYPELALMCSAIASATGWIIMRHKLQKKHCTIIEALGFSMLIGSGISFFSSFLWESWNPVPIYEFPAHFLSFTGYLFLAILFSNLIGYILYTELLKTYTTTFLSFAGFTEPLVAAFTGWLFLGESITWYFLLSATLVFCGLYIFYLEELKQGYIVKS